jgi:hypothetical protein
MILLSHQASRRSIDLGPVCRVVDDNFALVQIYIRFKVHKYLPCLICTVLIALSAMLLRDHPLMSYRGVKNWPPTWSSRKRPGESLRGEIGTLTFVLANPEFSDRAFLVIEYQGQSYVGSLLFDDHDFCRQMTALLKLQLKRPITEIGSIDLSSTL